MKPAILATALLPILLCTGIAACQTPAATPVAADALRAPACATADSTLAALEAGHITAIDRSIEMIACYDGASADRVDAALGDMLIQHPQTLFASLHARHTDPGIIGDIVTAQPWKLVDHPCAFAALLTRRKRTLRALTRYPRETSAANASLAEFMPTVTASCRAASQSPAAAPASR